MVRRPMQSCSTSDPDRCTDHDASNRTTVSRRGYLRAGAAVGTAATIGGCLGGSGESDDTLTVGYALPFTGTYAVLGQGIVNGFELYLNQNDGQIDGREVETIRRDTEGDTNRGIDVTRELLVEEQADVIVGPVSSAVAIAIMDTIESEGSAIWLNANAGDYRVTKEGCLDNHFRTSFNDWQTSAPLAEWVYENIADNVCLAYADYAFGQNSKNFFGEAFEAAGGEVVGEVGAPLGTDDYSTYLGEIENTGADAVFSFFAGSDAVAYVSDFADYGLDDEMTQTGSGFLLSEDTLPAQGEAARGMYSLLHYTPAHESEQNRMFLENYRNTYDSTANVYACQGYDSAQAFAAGVEKTGSAAPDQLSGALSGMELESPRGSFRFDEQTHDPVQNMYVREVVESDGEQPVENQVVETIDSVESPSWGCDLS